MKRFLNANLYDAPELRAVRSEAQRVVADLAAAYRSNPALLPPERQDAHPVIQARKIGDFIAGMTDRFAIAQHSEIVGKVSLPDRF